MSIRKPLHFGITALALAGAAHAQVSRVFVSVNGNDANVCSNIATPCRTFGGGVSQVDAHGEVIVIDSGSYAGGTITKSVKIDVAPGVVAFSGLPITVNPGAGQVVVLRGLTLKAATLGTGSGIAHQTGKLIVENVVLDGWLDGITSDAGAQSLSIKGCVSRNNARAGVLVWGGNTSHVAIDHSFFEQNSTGVLFEGGRPRVSNSVMSNNDFGAIASNAGTDATFQRCEASGNEFSGLQAQSGSILRVSESTLTRNNWGLAQSTGATVESFGNNVLRGNLTAATSGTITPVTLQ